MQGRSFGIAVAVTLFWSLPSPALQPLDVFVASARERNPDALEAKAGLSQQNAQSDVGQQTQQLAAALLQLSLAARALESNSGVFPDLSVPAPLADDLHNEPALASFEGELNRLPAVVAASGSTRAAEQDAGAQR